MNMYIWLYAYFGYQAWIPLNLDINCGLLVTGSGSQRRDDCSVFRWRWRRLRNYYFLRKSIGVLIRHIIIFSSILKTAAHSAAYVHVQGWWDFLPGGPEGFEWNCVTHMVTCFRLLYTCHCVMTGPGQTEPPSGGISNWRTLEWSRWLETIIGASHGNKWKFILVEFSFGNASEEPYRACITADTK